MVSNNGSLHDIRVCVCVWVRVCLRKRRGWAQGWAEKERECPPAAGRVGRAREPINENVSLARGV